VSKPSEVTVLVEDRLQERFVRRHLEKQLKCGNHAVRVLPLRSGKGSGEQWVRQRYAEAVAEYRWRATHARTALVVAIDADKYTVEHRTQQLRQCLAEAGGPTRADDERIAHLIPKWSIETCILCLNGKAVDEDTDYSHQLGAEEQVALAAETFYGWSRPNVSPPAHCVDSLRKAIPEVLRLK